MLNEIEETGRVFLNFTSEAEEGRVNRDQLLSQWQTRLTMMQVGHYMNLVMRKPDFCKCENKDADQLRGDRKADQRLYFHYMDSTIPLLSKSEISSL